MGKYFGTDGIRGRANENLTVEMAFNVGKYLGYMFSKNKRGRIIVGKDTRQSSSMLEMAIASGAMATGADVYLLGVVPTPTVAYITKTEGFDCGVMISASHNPYYDNGIKVFDSEGSKLAADLEDEIEVYLDGGSELLLSKDDQVGQCTFFEDGVAHYLQWMKSLVNIDASNLKIVIDCANGSSTTTALKMLSSLNAEVISMHDEPNGVNINTKCGSTHPELLQQAVIKHQADVGFAFDGDADRLIAVNHRGELVDGDKILYACGLHLKAKNLLKDNMIVTTVMSNLGLYKAFKQASIDFVQTQVGDKYVYEQMVQKDYKLGGEQSGHIIFKDHATTGDGLLTAVKILEVMIEQNKSLDELTKSVEIFPQLLKNVKVMDKFGVMENVELKDKIKELEEQLHGNGRILVRPSGTEPLVRVMVEASSEDVCHQLVNEVVDLIQTKGL